ncbi:MAG TPA: Clp protease N-terminal domain-containing protein, partial [Vicinamibacteria bacterium]
ALQLADAESEKEGAPSIGEEHLLLGILADPASTGGAILTARGVSPEAVRVELRGDRAEKAGARPAFAKLAGFLKQLEARGAGYRVASHLEDAVRVEVARTGEIWRATFFGDGHVAIEVLSAQGAVEDESALGRLLDLLEPPGERE